MGCEPVTFTGFADIINKRTNVTTHNNNSTHKQCHPVNPWRIIIILSFGKRIVCVERVQSIRQVATANTFSVTTQALAAPFRFPFFLHSFFRLNDILIRDRALAWAYSFICCCVSPAGSSELSLSLANNHCSMNTVRWKLNLFKINGRNDLGPAEFNGFSFCRDGERSKISPFPLSLCVDGVCAIVIVFRNATFKSKQWKSNGDGLRRM